jgi:hypothetical protein
MTTAVAANTSEPTSTATSGLATRLWYQSGSRGAPRRLRRRRSVLHRPGKQGAWCEAGGSWHPSWSAGAAG